MIKLGINLNELFNSNILMTEIKSKDYPFEHFDESITLFGSEKSEFHEI